MKKSAVILGLFLVLFLSSLFVLPKTVDAAPPQCYNQSGGAGSDGVIRTATCGGFRQLAALQFGRRPENALQQDKCYLMKFGSIQERGVNSSDCRAWRFLAQDPLPGGGDGGGRRDGGGGGGDVTNPFNTDPSGGAGKVCGDKNRKVTISINIGCRGKGNPVADMMLAFIRFLSIGVGVVAVGSIVVGGIQYTTSAGSPEKTAKAIGRISNTAIALLIYFLTFAILNWIVPGGVF